MKISLTFEQGPITAEVEATEEDDYAQFLEDLAEFLDDHPELVSGDGRSELDRESNGKEGGDGAEGEDEMDHTDKKESEELKVDNEFLRPILEEVGIEEEKFVRLFEVHEDVTPRILDADKLPGDSPGKKIMNASALILTLWQECYDETWMKTSELSDALEQSSLSDRTDYIYNQDNWKSLFDRDGEGRGTKLRVTRLGKDRSEDLMTQMTQ